MGGGFRLVLKKEANLLLEIIDRSVCHGTGEDLRQLVPGLQELILFELALCVLSGLNCSSAEPYRVINVSHPSADPSPKNCTAREWRLGIKTRTV